METGLAIVRRKLAGKRMTEPDKDHLHHMLRRSLGVNGAVLALYGIGVGFAVLGVALTLGRARVIYALALVFASYIAVYSIKIARRKQLEQEAIDGASRVAIPEDDEARSGSESGASPEAAGAP